MAAVPCSPVVQAIDPKSIHQICSGQVVLSIATAMKELVENSLDAGATNIDIKLKNHGADSLEVMDNGIGVEPRNFEALTLKHHTSKLRDFSDLTSVETFGFRGEALSSLCALSKLSVTTHHSSQATATRLEYDYTGKLLSQKPCARDVGTTVSLQDLFSTLPVRHREFLRNIKREFTKLVHVLQGYCLISTGVRITCSNQVDRGKKTTVVSTNGSEQVKDNITCVFGPKQAQTIVAIEQYIPSEEDCGELGLDAAKISEQEHLFKISGYISKPDHGMGRSSADRQFFYINKRPCDLSKVSRVINEVYHMYNRHQYPFVMLDVNLSRDGVDVNVTPDKRQVFVQEEKLLLATIKTSLKKLFNPSTASFDVNQKPLTQIKLSSDTCLPRQQSCENDVITPQHTHTSLPSRINQDEKISEPQTSVESFKLLMERGKFPLLSRFKRKFSCVEEGCSSKSKEPCSKQAKLTAIFIKEKVPTKKQKELVRTDMGHTNDSSEIQSTQSALGNNEQCRRSDVEVVESKKMQNSSKQANYGDDLNSGREIDLEGNKAEFVNNDLVLKTEQRFKLDLSNNIIKNELENREQGEESHQKMFDKTVDLPGEPILVIPKSFKKSSLRQDPISDMVRSRTEIKVEFSLEKVKTNLKTPLRMKTEGAEARLFRAKIAPDGNSSAEKELRKNISKDMFERMEILGQFNLGFIIAKLENDLFIIDQHASDEKFNFEEQQQNTTIKSQRLIIPQKLELTAANEAILIDNITVFQKNGFDFEIDHKAKAMEKVKLVSLPMSKNWTFGVEDIEELIFMLSDSPSVMCRPSRVRKMFASRACRMSIMVGTALNQAQMKKIVCHMGEIEHPWNCPHGRPTMRHLINLGMLPTADVE